jgi:phosphatidate phosphatase APP1
MKTKILLVLTMMLNCQAILARELVIISDLDETLRMANVEKMVKAAGKLVVGVKPYPAMQTIFNEIQAKNPDAKFYYLSNSYNFLYNADKWTRENNFPKGTSFQRCLKKDKSETFKAIKLKEIAAAHPDASFMLFGDNIDHDPKFYREFLSETQIKDARVFIRDARLLFTQVDDQTYYQTEDQITDDLNMSESTTSTVKNLPFNKLVPKFLLKNLKKRLVKECKTAAVSCEEAAERRVLEVIDQIKPAADLAQN